MSKNKSYSERRAYTFMDILGDFGGFNGSITFIVSTIFASYSAHMFETSIASQVKNARKLRNSQIA